MSNSFSSVLDEFSVNFCSSYLNFRSTAQTLHTVIGQGTKPVPKLCAIFSFAESSKTKRKKNTSSLREAVVTMENGFTEVEENVKTPPTYEEAFPPLGSPTLPGPDPTFPVPASCGRTQSAWPVKSIPSSTVTQVRVGLIKGARIRKGWTILNVLSLR